jgi:hypothetical protein
MTILIAPAFAEGQCEVAPEKFDEFMKQDYLTFDQTNKGWRSLIFGGRECDLTIALLIDSYNLGHQGKLKPSQERILYWHAGQSFGFLKLYDLAVARFSNSFDPTEAPNPEFHWNAYARASIAFLKKDKDALQKAHDEFSPVAPAELNNFKIVERFIRCFDSSYFDAYAGAGTCK